MKEKEFYYDEENGVVSYLDNDIEESDIIYRNTKNPYLALAFDRNRGTDSIEDIVGF